VNRLLDRATGTIVPFPGTALYPASSSASDRHDRADLVAKRSARGLSSVDRHDRACLEVFMSAAAQAEALAADVRSRRRALGLGQQDLADLSGASVRFVRNLEHGKPSIRLDKLVAVLDVLGLELRAGVRGR
jgi:HTH-type transcriptional regulator / antitoxin HipB